jgi:hypothetical protein
MADGDLKVFFIHGQGARADGPPGGFAWVRTDKRKSDWELLEEVTRNQAEYLAFESVLRYVLPESYVLIYTDEPLIVDQFAGRRRASISALRTLSRRMKQLMEEKQLDVEVKLSPKSEPNRAAQLLSERLQPYRFGLVYSRLKE